MRWIGSVLLVVAVVLEFAGCALPPKHEYQLAPGRGYTPEMRNALVVPLNQTEKLPGGLDKGKAVVWNAIVARLEAKGLQIETPEVRAYHEVATAALYEARRESLSGRGRRASETIDYGNLVPRIVQELGADVDVVIVPNMTIRKSESKGGRSEYWDGVRRRVPGTVGLNMTGSGTAASLHVVIYDAEGERIFSAFGGLDVLFSVNRQKERMELIPNRLEDLSNIEEGVCIAFHPFFGDESCR